MSILNWVRICKGFSHFFQVCSDNFVLDRLATSSIRVRMQESFTSHGAIFLKGWDSDSNVLGLVYSLGQATWTGETVISWIAATDPPWACYYWPLLQAITTFGTVYIWTLWRPGRQCYITSEIRLIRMDTIWFVWLKWSEGGWIREACGIPRGSGGDYYACPSSLAWCNIACYGWALIKYAGHTCHRCYDASDLCFRRHRWTLYDVVHASRAPCFYDMRRAPLVS